MSMNLRSGRNYDVPLVNLPKTPRAKNTVDQMQIYTISKESEDPKAPNPKDKLPPALRNRKVARCYLEFLNAVDIDRGESESERRAIANHTILRLRFANEQTEASEHAPAGTKGLLINLKVTPPYGNVIVQGVLTAATFIYDGPHMQCSRQWELPVGRNNYVRDLISVIVKNKMLPCGFNDEHPVSVRGCRDFNSQLIHRLDQAKFLNLPPNPFVIYNHFNSIWLDDAPWKATEVGYAGWSEAYKHVKIPDINYGGNFVRYERGIELPAPYTPPFSNGSQGHTNTPASGSGGRSHLTVEDIERWFEQAANPSEHSPDSDSMVSVSSKDSSSDSNSDEHRDKRRKSSPGKNFPTDPESHGASKETSHEGSESSSTLQEKSESSATLREKSEASPGSPENSQNREGSSIRRAGAMSILSRPSQTRERSSVGKSGHPSDTSGSSWESWESAYPDYMIYGRNTSGDWDSYDSQDSYEE